MRLRAPQAATACSPHRCTCVYHTIIAMAGLLAASLRRSTRVCTCHPSAALFSLLAQPNPWTTRCAEPQSPAAAIRALSGRASQVEGERDNRHAGTSVHADSWASSPACACFGCLPRPLLGHMPSPNMQSVSAQRCQHKRASVPAAVDVNCSVLRGPEDSAAEL